MKISRRGFLKGVGIATSAAVLGLNELGLDSTEALSKLALNPESELAAADQTLYWDPKKPWGHELAAKVLKEKV